MPTIVPRVTTPLPFRPIPDLISTCFRPVGTRGGGYPGGSPATPPPVPPTAGNVGITRTQGINLAVLVGIETARGSKIQNFNLGNIAAGQSYAGKAWRPPWFDADEAARDPQLASLHLAMTEGRAPDAFRAYDSLEEGLADFCRVLTLSFPEVLEAAKQTDPDVFRRAIAERYSHDYESNRAATETIRKLQAELGLTGSDAVGGAGFVLALLFFWWRLASPRPRRKQRERLRARA